MPSFADIDHVFGIVAVLNEIFDDLPDQPVNIDAVGNFNPKFLLELVQHVDVPDKSGHQLAVSSHPFIIHARFLSCRQSINRDRANRFVASYATIIMICRIIVNLSCSNVLTIYSKEYIINTKRM